MTLILEISVFGHQIYLTLIARRSNIYAGPRYLKRGVSDKVICGLNQGNAANECETEQIVNDASTTFFPSAIHLKGSGYTSFLQHRASIPLYWSQESIAMAAKPNIQMDLVDPYYTAAAKHFDSLFKRYESPIIVLNLIKAKEKIEKESILLEQFTEAISYLNQSLPNEKKIQHIAWDMARASKSQDQDVIGKLEDIAEQVLKTTSFFHTGVATCNSNPQQGKNSIACFTSEGSEIHRTQHGIVRTNCIDCLDRTNAAQFVIGKCALAHQLHALGILSEPTVLFDCDAGNLLNAMYHDHGDTIALQYGGSQLAHTMETYRKISRWTSHSRDMIESIKRYYSNSFTDAEKQDAMNLFLGVYVPRTDHPPLWELTTDFYLHNNPYNQVQPKSYINWWTPEHLVPHTPLNLETIQENNFELYYRPHVYTSLSTHFSFNLLSTAPKDEIQDVSPFAIRTNTQQANRYLMMYNLNIGGVKRWLALNDKPKIEEVTVEHAKSVRKSQKAVHGPSNSTAALVESLMNPQVKVTEEREYNRYTLFNYRYVAQFESSKIKLTSSISIESFDNQFEIPDYELFSDYILSTGETSKEVSDMFSVDLKTESIYKKYIHQGTTEAVLGGNSLASDLHRKDIYGRWLSKGALPSRFAKQNV